MRATTLLGTVALASSLAASSPAAQMPADSAALGNRAVDVLHYDLAITLPDTGRTITGRSDLLLRRGPLAHTLRVDILLAVDSVRVGGVTTDFARRDGGISVALDGAADTMAVSVFYHGAPTDGLIVSADPQGRWQAFGDNWPDRARHWLAVVDRPGDKATVSWTVSAPAALTVIANGTRTDSLTVGNRTTWRWTEGHPIATYLMVIAAAPLRAFPIASTHCLTIVGGGCLAQTVYVAADQAAAPPAFAESEGIVDFYSAIVAPFPYEKLAHLQSTTRFGGMENATAIFYADGAFRRGRMSSSLIAHETAHQWFGDAVTERDWAHLWLSEGFATYFALLWKERSRGRDSLVAGLRAMRGEILADSVVAARPVIDSAQSAPMLLLNTNSYQKGGYFLHMARRLLGDSAFFAGVRRYYEAHRDGNATTDDLRVALEGTSGRELGWFFDQWLRRPGFPRVEARWSYDRREKRVYLQTVQRGRFGNFRLPLVIEMKRADGTVARATVEIPARASARVVVPVELSAPPVRVTLDPDADLLADIAPPLPRRDDSPHDASPDAPSRPRSSARGARRIHPARLECAALRRAGRLAAPPRPCR